MYNFVDTKIYSVNLLIQTFSVRGTTAWSGATEIIERKENLLETDDPI